MSNLNQPYELSLWEDIWSESENKFVEQRICVIGSNNMSSGSRAFDPLFTRNTNGVKKLSFKLYKKYIDTFTGEEVNNPFFDYLVNERKVKLKYKNKWHDFVIKNIVENSADYLYTYQLEDAMVQELAKNGFDVVLDEKIIDKDGTSNVGTAAELATKVLRETDWDVVSEKVVETVEEALVYVNLTEVKAIPILDQNKTDYSTGVTFEEETTLSGRALAFYSSCTNQPHRFQFIYLGTDDDGNTIVPMTDDFRNITNANCQYYIDISNPSEGYTNVNNTNYYLPSNITLATTVYEDDNRPISSLYRGKRYGFTQKTQYLPQIDKYVNVYEKSEDGTKQEYYGYQKARYCSPVLIQNLISNYDFKEGSGWTGATLIDKGEKATVEAVYGHFVGQRFVSAMYEMASGTDITKVTDYNSYLKIEFPTSGGAVINSCLYDNRTIIENIEPNTKFVLSYSYYTDKGTLVTNTGLSCFLGEYYYEDGIYQQDQTDKKIEFFPFKEDTNSSYLISSIESNTYSKEEFRKNSQVKLCIQPIDGTIGSRTIYLKEIELFEAVYLENGNLLTPLSKIQGEDDQGNVATIQDRVIDKTYYYFTNNDLNKVKNEDQLKPAHVAKVLSYDIYKPVYNTGAEKVRSVTAKESNYFNILQNIAETFGMWLLLDIEHSDGTDGLTEGAIKQKKVCFKHYAGGNNYAGFKYGVNLKDIQRTYESKDIVTKLIVKPNNNQYAQNGFCSISRANSNPVGEDCIYDFQYYHNKGLLDIGDYNDYVYGTGKYFDQLKQLNLNIQKYNTLLTNLSADLTQLKAQKEVAEAGLAAARAGLEETAENFEQLTGFAITKSLPRQAGEGDEDYNDRKETFDKREDIIKLRRARLEYLCNEQEYSQQLADLATPLSQAELSYLVYNAGLETFLASKRNLNHAFFSRYSRFIQEGTWIDEEYVDDEKYFIDAQSVMYNSCYPQVAYTINVMAVSLLPGYEQYDFNVGETTFVEDKEFFGTDERIEVNITETIEALDDPTKDQIKVQTFKNQFQDLFQKITATVQQTQYSTGAYQKAVALAEANQAKKQAFFQDALSDASAVLATAGQQTVTQGIDGITVRSVDSPADAVRIVGGAILLGRQDENGQQKWVTGVTSRGISANLITAGIINAGEISIMSSEGPTFRWDAYGISAFDFGTDADGNINSINSNNFVRFDKYGLYGITNKDGLSWHATNMTDLQNEATFALTWEGLKVTGNDNTEARIGKQGNYIMTVQDAKGNQTFGIDSNGNATFTGAITANAGELGGFNINTPLIEGGPLSGGLSYGWKGTEGSFVLLPSGNYSGWSTTIAGQSRNDWTLMIGSEFGVTKNGQVSDSVLTKAPDEEDLGNTVFLKQINDNETSSYYAINYKFGLDLTSDGFCQIYYQSKPYEFNGTPTGAVYENTTLLEEEYGTYYAPSEFTNDEELKRTDEIRKKVSWRKFFDSFN